MTDGISVTPVVAPAQLGVDVGLGPRVAYENVPSGQDQPDAPCAQDPNRPKVPPSRYRPYRNQKAVDHQIGDQVSAKIAAGLNPSTGSFSFVAVSPIRYLSGPVPFMYRHGHHLYEYLGLRG